VLTPEIERAFPGRVVRDASGRLVSIDSRAINYAASEADELRLGFNFGRQIGGAAGGGRAGPPPGQRMPGGTGRGGGFGGGHFGGPGKRAQASLFYTARLKDRIEIAPGLPPLDLLNGSATGFLGGASRHRIDAEAGWFNNGLGIRAILAWQSGSLVRGGPLPGGGTATDLRFSGLATINLRFFLNIDQRKSIVEALPFLKGSRVSLRINNLGNEIRTVRDEDGLTPLRYQPGYLDPLGRTVEISFRKLF
jgi:hypothetical protein